MRTTLTAPIVAFLFAIASLAPVHANSQICLASLQDPNTRERIEKALETSGCQSGDIIMLRATQAFSIAAVCDFSEQMTVIPGPPSAPSAFLICAIADHVRTVRTMPK